MLQPLFVSVFFICFSYGKGHYAAQSFRNSRIADSLRRPHGDGIHQHIVVVGSVNADTFLSVLRLPTEGENLTTLCEPWTDVPGGKGCTQAVAVAKLLLSQNNGSGLNSTSTVTFVGQFGNDDAAQLLRRSLESVGVDLQYSEFHTDIGSGRGYVFASQDNGSVSAVVSGGANIHGWDKYESIWDRYIASNRDPDILRSVDNDLHTLFSKPGHDSTARTEFMVMLQREIPEKVNLLVATYCEVILKEGGGAVTVVLDCGGEDRPISSEMLKLCDFVMPNETELRRLVESLPRSSALDDMHFAMDSQLSNSDVLKLAAVVLWNGARNVVVTRGKYGSTWVSLPANEAADLESLLTHHEAAFLDDKVVDETGAGDCYRAGFVVANLLLRRLLLSDLSNIIPDCMVLASAAGACAVTQRGAVPATPSKADVLNRLLGSDIKRSKVDCEPSSYLTTIDAIRGGFNDPDGDDDFPFDIGSRLNSMKDRPELWGSSLKSPEDFVLRQARIKGLTCVDFNYPQHFNDFWSSAEAKAALDETGLKAGAVCLRYPSPLFARGAMNHPEPELRRQAIQLTMNAAQVAMDLGCQEVVVWSAFDGYDYPFQVDYDTKWQELVDAFQECCDRFPSVKFSLEYKPTDENTRFFTVPSTGAALLMVQEVNRPNFGLTLDVGHMLMAGENPAQSIAMVGRVGKLFGVQLNDGYTRLAAEDGLMFGSVHPRMALEIMYQLKRIHFDGHIYFDTFPQRSDPIKEAEYNIRRVKAFWNAALTLSNNDKLVEIMRDHDAVASLDLVDSALKNL
jgi:sugar/nucleoside kinase (ribokinase family)/sugar phosphate isomerase/epimerase